MPESAQSQSQSQYENRDPRRIRPEAGAAGGEAFAGVAVAVPPGKGPALRCVAAGDYWFRDESAEGRHGRGGPVVPR